MAVASTIVSFCGMCKDARRRFETVTEKFAETVSGSC